MADHTQEPAGARHGSGAVNAGKPTPEFFKLRTQMLEQGRTAATLARTKSMWMTLKVYSSGGENGLHTHPNEDHLFVIMQGSARFYDPDGKHTDVGTHEGVMLPAGVYYWFEATSKDPLVLLRVGCRLGSEDPLARLNIHGAPMPHDSKENKREPTVFREGVFFE